MYTAVFKGLMCYYLVPVSDMGFSTYQQAARHMNSLLSLASLIDYEAGHHPPIDPRAWWCSGNAFLLPGRWKPDVLRPGIVEMRGATVIFFFPITFTFQPNS